MYTHFSTKNNQSESLSTTLVENSAFSTTLAEGCDVARGSLPPQGARDHSTLSKPHIGTFGIAKFYEGGNLIKVSKPKGKFLSKHTCGIRGTIKDFSKASRRRLLQRLSMTRKDEKPLFVTLTYPGLFPKDTAIWKAHRKAFFMRLKRAFPDAGLMWKLEPQERGAPHYHMFVWGVKFYELRDWVPQAWFEIAGNGDKNHLAFHQGRLKNSELCVQEIRTWRGVMSYASKYMGKVCDASGWEQPGRFWGCIGSDCIPWAKLVERDVTLPQVYKLFRLMRRAMRSRRARRARNLPSLSLFCDASFWLSNLDRLL